MTALNFLSDDYLMNNELDADIDKLFNNDLGLPTEWNIFETDGDFIKSNKLDNDYDSNDCSSLSPSSSSSSQEQNNHILSQRIKQETEDKYQNGSIFNEFVDEDKLSLINDLLSKNFGNITELNNNNVLIDDNGFENVVEIGTSSLIDLNDNCLLNNSINNNSSLTDINDSYNDDDDEDEMDDEDDSQYLSPAESIEIHHNYCFNKKYSSSEQSNSPNSRKKCSNLNRNCDTNTISTIKPSTTSGRMNSRNKGQIDIVLTEEEIRLLNKEGYKDFPSGNTQLTKQEEKILRKIRRKIRNKRSAQCSRQRKKEYLDDLERRYEKCSNDNHSLRRENLKLKKSNENLLIKIKKLLMLTGLTNGQASFKTSFLVLILSFLLVIFPYFRPESIDDNYIGLMSEKTVIGTGRQLLNTFNINDSDIGYNSNTNHNYHSIYYGSDINDTLKNFIDYTTDLNAF